MNHYVVLTLTKEQYNTIRNMVDFATWHAANGLSPALKEHALEKANTLDAYDKLYAEQMELVCSARVAIGLEARGDYDK